METETENTTENTEVATTDTTVAVKPSSIFLNNKIEQVELNQNKMSTPFLLVFLIVVFFVLKTFIYKKDDKRHGK